MILEDNVCNLNEWIGPDLKYEQNDHVQHRDLVKLIDNKLINEFKHIASTRDMARINAVSCNGASGWMLLKNVKKIKEINMTITHL